MPTSLTKGTHMESSINLIDQLSDEIAQKIALRTGDSEHVKTEIEGLSFYREDAVSGCTVCVVEPSIAVVVQGAKSMSLGKETYKYDRNNFLITSLDIPATMQVLEANTVEPYLGLALKLDLRVVSELMLQIKQPAQQSKDCGVGMILGQTTPALMECLYRLVSLLDEPDSIPVLTPLITREICWRVLNSEQGARLRQIVSIGSQGHRIARTIEWLKQHYNQNSRVEDLAEIAQMSPSTFHLHFRQLTSMSPLQYQKYLRLTEARRLMLGENMDASKVAYQVGYESPSQFSREYSRLFGAPPKKDIERIKQAQHIQ
ncbi:AraC family transcriptional regulator N-terminal domain-containing protein [Celerinatantimonas sp. YJH-8]|uniref:AraC family transcriptional regulator n=1 Tax=Celerinatantimonas sp. YJH-8 TaxID=3228714 RepID=UPI0038C45F94